MPSTLPPSQPTIPYTDYYGTNLYHPTSMAYPANPYMTPSRPFFGDVAAGTNSVFDGLRMFAQGISSFAQFIDSTVYAGWSSVTALTTVVDNLRSLKNNYLAKLLTFLKRILQYWTNIIRIPSKAVGGKIAIVAALATILPLLSKLVASLISGSIQEIEVISPYITNEPGHLAASQGDRLKVLVSEKDWVYAEGSDGKRGCFPKTHLQTPINN